MISYENQSAHLEKGCAAPDTELPELEAVAGFIQRCFDDEALGALLNGRATEAQRVAQEWLLTGGKRWRPLLAAAVYEAAGGAMERLRPVVVAVECFHKASLVHDDIQDGDSERYGTPTVHARIGIPAAINIGDYLIGEGYRLLAESSFPDDARVKMLQAAANGHRELCLGQGEELLFCRQPAPLEAEMVLKIYAQKTAAAFEVAVQLGAAAAGVDAATRAQLSEFSQAVGTAYQIQDDIEDFHPVRGRGADLLALRPTLYLAAACASGEPEIGAALATVWRGEPGGRQRLMDAITAAGLHQVVLEHYRHHLSRAARALDALEHAELRKLLRGILGQMLTQEVACCPTGKNGIEAAAGKA